MPRVLGVDPRTKTFDLVVIKAERGLETATIAKNPSELINAIKSFNADYIAAPSGYGVPVTRVQMS